MIYTLATAGHIDHGKSTLIRALTGINPDRLPEELSREMTIDLGFAWFALKSGDEVGIVDVPGHERFIRNMIAGVGGIDYVLFVVAADDGWMPQSQEHLEILQFLNHRHGAIVLTKTDLVEEDWLLLVEEDIREKVKHTFLYNAPILPFSAKGNRGLDLIQKHLAESLSKLPERYNPHKPRLYIDRAFSLPGIGTVVTGTMRDGSIMSGDELRIVSSRKTARVKSIQTFKQKRDEAFQGARTALSLTGVSKEEISRGDCLVGPDDYDGSSSLAVRVEMSSFARIPLNHNRILSLKVGTSEFDVRIKMFKDDRFLAGDEGVIVCHAQERIMARLGDRVILRYPTPDLLAAGGEIVDVDLTGFRRNDKSLRKFYLERDLAHIDSLILTELRKYKTRASGELLRASNFNREDVERNLNTLIDDGRVIRYGNLLVGAEYKDRLIKKVLSHLEDFHGRNPMLPGVGKAELMSKLKLSEEELEFALSILESEKQVEADRKFIRLAGYRAGLKPEHRDVRKDILSRLTAPDLLTPTRREIERGHHVTRQVLNFLVRSGEVIELSGGILFKAEDFDKIKDTVIDTIKSQGNLEVKQLKEKLGLTRKYTIPILEYLDRQGVTRREGDRRVLAE
ncbi:MAG: selenocysteine-specific translation elongation factor [candidate division Zixibacteria bacterium]|nr:selenocysteine-specific translation elongation factor [candidate division Zixibacteria bacterium]